jgi:hypothetical protein
MGISMRLYLAPDPDLRAFSVAPTALKTWLHYPRTLPEVNLHEYWRDLDAILASTDVANGKSLLTPGAADWTYPDIGDRGAYGISSTSMALLLRAVDEVDRIAVEAYVVRRWTRQALATGQSPELTPLQVSSSSGELLLYLGRLRDICTLGVAKGYGVLMALWEEL